MPGTVPQNPKIYHITHVSNLVSVIEDSALWSDEEATRRKSPDEKIGMPKIKQRRLTELKLQSHPDLFVGQCVPFYFCPRSIMLYLYHMNNHIDLTYHGGQGPIVHLEADLNKVVRKADKKSIRWAFTSSNAGSYYFDDFADLNQLNKINWDVVQSTDWRGQQEAKQAEFLVYRSFPWKLVERIGVKSQAVYSQVHEILREAAHKPQCEIMPGWYY